MMVKQRHEIKGTAATEWNEVVIDSKAHDQSLKQSAAGLIAAFVVPVSAQCDRNCIRELLAIRDAATEHLNLLEPLPLLASMKMVVTLLSKCSTLSHHPLDPAQARAQAQRRQTQPEAAVGVVPRVRLLQIAMAMLTVGLVKSNALDLVLGYGVHRHLFKLLPLLQFHSIRCADALCILTWHIVI
jgi:hypothetical protein